MVENLNHITHANLMIGVKSFVVAVREVTDRYGRYDGQIFTLFFPETNKIGTKHSRTSMGNTYMQKTPENVFTQYEALRRSQ